MPFAYEKLPTLDRDRLVETIDPVLSEHGLEGVELIWKKGGGSWVLYLTVERPEGAAPKSVIPKPGVAERETADERMGPDAGAGVTLDECSRLSRAVSEALDEADLIKPAYRLEVGTPGIERRLYSAEDFRRFVGKLARIKTVASAGGRGALVGRLRGVDEEEQILLETGDGSVALDFPSIESARLELDPSAYGFAQSKKDPAVSAGAK